MKHAQIMLLMAVASFLLLGCTGNTAQEGTNQTAGAANASAGAAAPQNSTAAGNATEAQQPEDAPAEPQAPAPKTYSAGFSELIAMGIPLECDVSYTYAGKQAAARLLIGEDSDFRVESSVGMVQCTKTVTVIRDSRQYVGCSNKQVMPSCDWFKSAYDTAKPGVASNFDFSSVPASSISCRDWAYDSAMFRTNGSICELG